MAFWQGKTFLPMLGLVRSSIFSTGLLLAMDLEESIMSSLTHNLPCFVLSLSSSLPSIPRHSSFPVISIIPPVYISPLLSLWTNLQANANKVELTSHNLQMKASQSHALPAKAETGIESKRTSILIRRRLRYMYIVSGKGRELQRDEGGGCISGQRGKVSGKELHKDTRSCR